MYRLALGKTELQLLIIAVLILVCSGLESMGIVFLPLFSLCAGSGGGGGGGGGGGCGAGCGSSSGASSEGADFGGSTPFLYVWRAGAFHIENDVMISKPGGLFSSKERGRSAYEQGKIGHDIYLIQNPPERVAGKLRFQLRELEPEESFIDYFSLLRVVRPRDQRLFVNALENKLVSFSRSALERGKGVTDFTIRDVNSERDLTAALSMHRAVSLAQSRRDAYAMEAGAQFEIKARVKDRTAPVYLFLESHFRDWTAGEILSFKNQPSLYAFLRSSLNEDVPVLRKAARLAVGVAVFALFSIANFAGSITHPKEPLGDALLLGAWGIPRAHADVPASCSASGSCNSLRVEYWDGSSFKELDIVSPRYYKPAFDVIRLPYAANAAGGEITIRVTATAQHNVTTVGLVADQVPEIKNVEEFKVSGAAHEREGKNYADVLNSPHSGEYMRTIPADLVSLEVDLVGARPLEEGETEEFLVKISGHYNPASEEVQREAAGRNDSWLSKLDPEAQSWVKEMYALRTFPSDSLKS